MDLHRGAIGKIFREGKKPRATGLTPNNVKVIIDDAEAIISLEAGGDREGSSPEKFLLEVKGGHGKGKREVPMAEGRVRAKEEEAMSPLCEVRDAEREG